MAQTTMVDIAAGQKLLRQLARDGFPLTAAAWVKTADDSQWFLYLVSPMVEQQGLLETYKGVHQSLDSLGDLSIRSSDVKVVADTDRAGKGLRTPIDALARQYPRLRDAISWDGQIFGFDSLEGAYLYPPGVYENSLRGPMTREQILARTVELMNPDRWASPSPSVRLSDGTTFEGRPIGVEVVKQGMQIKFLVDQEPSPRVYPVEVIAEIR